MSSLKCPECGREIQSKSGLSLHLKKCNKPKPEKTSYAPNHAPAANRAPSSLDEWVRTYYMKYNHLGYADMIDHISTVFKLSAFVKYKKWKLHDMLSKLESMVKGK